MLSHRSMRCHKAWLPVKADWRGAFRCPACAADAARLAAAPYAWEAALHSQMVPAAGIQTGDCTATSDSHSTGGHWCWRPVVRMVLARLACRACAPAVRHGSLTRLPYLTRQSPLNWPQSPHNVRRTSLRASIYPAIHRQESKGARAGATAPLAKPGRWLRSG